MRFLEALPPVGAQPSEAEPRGRGFPGRAWEPEEDRLKAGLQLGTTNQESGRFADS